MTQTDLFKLFEERGYFAHQANFAAAFLAPNAKSRHLLIGAPGLGKTFIAGAIVNHTMSSGLARRILVLSPPALLQQWRDTIEGAVCTVPLLVVDRPRLRELEASQPVGQDFWPSNAVVIMSIDLAKREDVADSLTRTSWDLLIVDEVQLVTEQNRRGWLLRYLLSHSPSMRVIYLGVDGMVYGSPIDIKSELFHDVAMTVWSRDAVLDREGRPLLPNVRFDWIKYGRHPDEVAVLSRLQQWWQSMRDAGDTRWRFGAANLLQAASSSLFALEQQLRRLQQRRNELVHGVAAIGSVEANEDETEWPLVSAMADVVGVQLTVNEIATPLLQMLEEVATDSKADSLRQTLEALGVKKGADRRVCLYTRFVDTAMYLETVLRDSDLVVRLLTGRLDAVDRERIVADFVRNGGVLIATDSVAAAIPEVAAVLFYDLPLSPRTLEARISQFVRVGRHGPVRILAFIDEMNALVTERLQKRIVEAKETVSEHEIERALFAGTDNEGQGAL